MKNYFQSRGVTVKKVVATCKQLGLNPCNWSHLSAAYEMCKVNAIKF